MKKTLLILLLLTSFISIAQSTKSYLTEKEKKRIERNILIGRILDEIDLEDFHYFSSDDYILPDNCRLDLKYELIEKDYLKDKDIILYKVTNVNYNFVNKKDGYLHFKLFSHGGFDPLKRMFLVGISKKDKFYIDYISGVFVKTKFAYNFDLDIKKPNSFKNFLELKLFNYQITEPNFSRKTRKYIIFKAYSKMLSKKIKIKVDKKEFDRLKIEILK